MRRPSRSAIETACAWLAINNGDEGESDDCQAVARWLLEQLDKAEFETGVRQIAKEVGCSPSEARKALRKSMA